MKATNSTNRTWQVVAGSALGLMLLAAPALAGWPGDPAKCMPDAVKAGSVCMDKYEASVWQVPDPTTTNKGLVKKIQNGTATLAKLWAGGATQISVASGGTCSPAFPATFPANGQWTEPLYAVSIPGVHPTACVTWFQAQQACGNARKRLPSNAEWQMAVAGTQDPGPDNGTTDCNTASVGVAVDTGSRSGCLSSWGAFDMVGNVYELTADWVPRSTACPDWGAFSNDHQCFAGADTTGEPGVLVRGGGFNGSGGNGDPNGPLDIFGYNGPSHSSNHTGFRCAR